MMRIDQIRRRLLAGLLLLLAAGTLHAAETEPAATEAAAPAEEAEEAARVVFVMDGVMKGDAVTEREQRVAAKRLEATLTNKLKEVMNIKSFDEGIVEELQKDEEGWAVLTGGDVSDVRAVLEKYAIDRLVRVYYTLKPVAKIGDVYSGTAEMTIEIVSKATGEKELFLVSPVMGTVEHPAVRALDPGDAAFAAIEYAAEQVLLELKKALGRPVETGDAVPERSVAQEPAKPTVAVLWIRPDFGYWRLPRSRQPGWNIRARKKMKEYVDYTKETNEIGVKVAHYLVQGLVESGQLVPVEESAAARQRIADIENKLLQYRMAGWVEERLPYSDPVQISRELGADYLVTAKITDIHESARSMGGPFFSSSKITAHATAEVTITDVHTGASRSYTGEGEFFVEGYGTFLTFEASNFALDKTMIGGAIKRALRDAASKIRV